MEPVDRAPAETRPLCEYRLLMREMEERRMHRGERKAEDTSRPEPPDAVLGFLSWTQMLVETSQGGGREGTGSWYFNKLEYRIRRLESKRQKERKRRGTMGDRNNVTDRNVYRGETSSQLFEPIEETRKIKKGGGRIVPWADSQPQELKS